MYLSFTIRHLSIFQSLHLSNDQSLHPSNDQSFHPSIVSSYFHRSTVPPFNNQSFHPSIMFHRPSIVLSFHPSILQTINHSIFPSLQLSNDQPFHPSNDQCPRTQGLQNFLHSPSFAELTTFHPEHCVIKIHKNTYLIQIRSIVGILPDVSLDCFNCWSFEDHV